MCLILYELAVVPFPGPNVLSTKTGLVLICNSISLCKLKRHTSTSTSTSHGTMTTTRIAELSQRIATNTTKINAFFVANNIPEPSFSLDASPHLAIPQTETEILSARREVINDTQELRELMLGPREHLSSYDVRLPFTGFDIHDFQWEFYTQMLTEDWTQENSLVSTPRLLSGSLPVSYVLR